MRKKGGMSKTEFLRSWGIYNRSGFGWLRYHYPPEKGIYWYWFSLYIRERDVKKYGTCISCGRAITVDTCDAGHFMPASDCGLDLLFDEQNVNAECSHCNAWDSTHLLGYAEGLDKRYGLGTATAIRVRRAAHKAKKTVTKELKGDEYAAKIRLLPTYLSTVRGGGQQIGAIV